MTSTCRFIHIRTFAVLPVLCAVMQVGLPAQTFTSLSLDATRGANPFAAPVQALNGSLYGTAEMGGGNGYGSIFQIRSGGTLTSLYNFDRTDGANPQAGLIQATNGFLYGVANGGANDDGVVFQVTPGGRLTKLHDFDFSDGRQPNGLTEGVDGNFYGTTSSGGIVGTIFKMTPAGTLTVLHGFLGTDGADPIGLIQAANGDLYGVTSAGGANDSGTVFKITTAGVLTTLYSFSGVDGSAPVGLIQSTDGNLYGTTLAGGLYNSGTIFKITPTGTLTVLHSFNGADGYEPNLLLRATDGDFYGTTQFGGVNTNNCGTGMGCGTIFSITRQGNLTTLYSFCPQIGCADGYLPKGAMIQDTNGAFYGATFYGGRSATCYNGCGTVFSLNVGLGPFVTTLPTLGKVGENVRVLGTNLTGTTRVTFNGVAATFKVVTSSLVTTTVPTGATTGTVQVVTPSGTLSSNVVFRVR